MLTLPASAHEFQTVQKQTYRAKFCVIPECRQTLTCRNEINCREKELGSIQSSAVLLQECCCDPRIKTRNLQVSDRRLKLEGRNAPDEDASCSRRVSAETWITESIWSRPKKVQKWRTCDRPHPSARRDLETFRITEIIWLRVQVSDRDRTRTPPHHMCCSPFCRIPKNSGINHVKLSF